MCNFSISPVPHQRVTRKPRLKLVRLIRWLTAPLSGTKPYAAVRITCGRVIASYYVREIGAPDGRGFEVEKIDLLTPLTERNIYHVYFAWNGQDHSCDCMGFLRHGRCKHV